MAIELVRVDNRLVHGQVLEGWVPRLRVRIVAAVDPQLAHDPAQIEALGVLLGGSIELQALDLPQFLEPGEQEHLRGARSMVLFRDVGTALSAYREGFRFTALNIANLHGGPGRRGVLPGVYLDESDRAALEDLRAHGVTLDFRAAPSDRPGDPRRALAPAP